MSARPHSAAPTAPSLWSAGDSDSDEDGEPKEPVETPAQKGQRLIVACKSGDEDEVRSLCLEGADVNAEDPCSHWTPLLWASCNGNLDCVNVLLEFKASHIYIDPERLKQHVRHSNGSLVAAALTRAAATAARAPPIPLGPQLDRSSLVRVCLPQPLAPNPSPQCC